MSQILDIAEQYGLILVEDTAHALFSKYRGKFLGTLGHLGCLSFHETKTIISGEGGALLVNDERFVARSEIIREKGTDRSRFYRGEVDKYTWVDLGSSYLPGELIAVDRGRGEIAPDFRSAVKQFGRDEIYIRWQCVGKPSISLRIPPPAATHLVIAEFQAVTDQLPRQQASTFQGFLYVQVGTGESSHLVAVVAREDISRNWSYHLVGEG